MDQKLLISALLEAHAKGHGHEVMAEVNSMANEPWHDEEPGDPEAHERVKAQLLKRSLEKLDKAHHAKKSLEGHRVVFDDSLLPRRKKPDIKEKELLEIDAGETGKVEEPNGPADKTKMSMVHGKKDELTSGLGQHQVGKK